MSFFENTLDKHDLDLSLELQQLKIYIKILDKVGRREFFSLLDLNTEKHDPQIE